ncbi:hypothetical protein RAZWK3B_09661 [Roseobacter sp. AzwK-3b]|nr:hypothetical protein RAZWK3B_09661 [Roseobacter sp. AzwK-3b]
MLRFGLTTLQQRSTLGQLQQLTSQVFQKNSEQRCWQIITTKFWM